MRLPIRHNGDLRRRELEQAVGQGDPEAVLALDMDLKRSGEWTDYYARQLIEGLIEDASVRTARASPQYQPNAAQVFRGREGGPLVLGPGNEDQIFVPDRFGRSQGLSITIRVERESLGYSYAGGMRREFAPSLQVSLIVALIPPRPRDGVILNPIYWFLRNDKRWRVPIEDRFARKLPSRSHSEHLTLNDLQSWHRIDTGDLVEGEESYYRGPRDRPGAVEAVAWALGQAMEDLNIRLGWAEEAVGRVEGSLGPSPSGTQVLEWVASDSRSESRWDIQRALDKLQTAPGPFVGLNAPGKVEPVVPAWNVSGGGVLEAALTSLGQWLQSNERAEVREIRADAYGQDSGYFARGYMQVTSSRARQTQNPLRFEVDFDAVNGAWAGRGDEWIGNRIPSGGIWRINMTNTPATAAEFTRPAIQWIKQVFPDSVIEVAAWWESGTTRPDYRREYPK